MLTFFLFIIFIVVFLFLMLGASVLRIFRVFIPGRRPYTSGGATGRRRQSNTSYSYQTYTEEDETILRKKKVFAEDEGEYVDYEEIH